MIHVIAARRIAASPASERSRAAPGVDLGPWGG